MSSIMNYSCIYCSKECKISDSKPYPNSKSKDRIHFKCQVKKSLTDRQQKTQASSFGETPDIKPRGSFGVLNKFIDEKEKLEKIESEKKMTRLIESQEKLSDKNNSTFFFDVKAGIAKPHEKKIYLHHRNLSEIGSRYNDQGFQEETIGRAYDHSGKDLMTLGDDSGDEHEDESKPKKRPHKECSYLKSDKKNLQSDVHNNESRPPLKKSRKFKAIQVDEKNPCWFCLSSPNVEKHLIITIGEHCYLTLAKGGLVDEHFLIIPIDHIESSNAEQNSKDLLNELEDFRQSIINFFSDQNQGVVFFERNFRSVHWQVQAVPVPMDKMEWLPAQIKSISKKHYSGAEYIDIPSNCILSDIIPSRAPYFYWHIEPIGVKFASQLQVKGRDSFFPIQLGRIILASPQILNCPDKVDWKQCVKSSEDYANLVKLVREKYKPHDITE